MLYQLLKRNPLKILLVLTPLFTFGAWFLPGDMAFLSGFISGLTGSLTVVMLTVGRLHERATVFESALPIDGRDLLKVRLYTLLYLLTAPLLAALLGAFAAGRHVEWSGVEKGMQLWALAMSAMGSALFLKMPRRVVPWQGMLGLAVPGWIGAILAVAKLPSNVVWVLCLFASLAMATFIRRHTPKREFGFQFAPLELKGAPKAAADNGRRMPGWWPLIRALYPWQGQLWLGYACFMPLVSSLLMPLCFLPILIAVGAQNFRWLFGLPLRRSTILAALVVPYLACWFTATAIDLNFGMDRSRPKSLHYEIAGETVNRIESGFEFWRVAPNGVAPSIEAPWGETVRPELRSLYFFSLYDPFEAKPEHSARFRRWQFERATEAVYGQALTIEELSKQGRPRTVARTLKYELIEFGILLVVAGGAIVVVQAAGWYRFNRLPLRGLKYYQAALMMVPILAVTLVPLVLTKYAGPSQVLDFCAFALAEAAPGDGATVLSLLLAVVTGLVFLLRRQFDEYELTGNAGAGCNQAGYLWGR